MPTIGEVIKETDDRMGKSVDALTRELAALVESLVVDYYGVPTPLNQLATISIPEARSLMIQPWDKASMKEVEKSIMASDLGLMPNNDGNAIRINVPMLTEERRRDLVRLVGRKVEESNVSVRNIRRDSLETFRSMERDKEISQDESRRAQTELQQLTDLYIEQMGELKKTKETEVMEV